MSTMTAEPTQAEVRALRERLETLAAERKHNLSADLFTRPLTISQIQSMTRFLDRQPYRDPKAHNERRRAYNDGEIGVTDEEAALLEHPVDTRKPVNTQPLAAPSGILPPNKYFIFIPPGRYAVPSLTGNNDLDFFETEHGKPGTKWEGFTFVERIIGGNPNSPVRGEQARRYLKAIEDYGWEASRLLAAQELGVCMDCGNSLTDEESRKRGKGPVCANK